MVVRVTTELVRALAKAISGSSLPARRRPAGRVPRCASLPAGSPTGPSTACRDGSRRPGSIADLADFDDKPDPEVSTVERERTFLVGEHPSLNGSGCCIRQGYIAIDRRVAVRVREQSEIGATLTIKAGAGASRTEIEWPIEQAQFDALWPLAEGRRVEKTRHRVPVGEHVAEVDVFAGSLDGLWLIDVEFASDEALAAFDPPAWFGPEVTDDLRYSNAHLAVYGWEARFDDLPS